MSMNFGREQALLRQRLTEKGSEERKQQLEARYGAGIKCLGADDAEVTAAAADLTEQFPEMGRAQMTAFVRTLWGSKTHELRAAAFEILRRRAELLEPPDLPFVEGLLKDCHDDQLSEGLAEHVLGALVCRHKKLWRDLQKLAKSKDEALRLAAVRAAKAPCASDGSVLDRFGKVVAPIAQTAEGPLQRAIGDVLSAAAAQDAAAAKAFAAEHGLQFPG